MRIVIPDDAKTFREALEKARDNDIIYIKEGGYK